MDWGIYIVHFVCCSWGRKALSSHCHSLHHQHACLFAAAHPRNCCFTKCMTKPKTIPHSSFYHQLILKAMRICTDVQTIWKLTSAKECKTILSIGWFQLETTWRNQCCLECCKERETRCETRYKEWERYKVIQCARREGERERCTRKILRLRIILSRWC